MLLEFCKIAVKQKALRKSHAGNIIIDMKKIHDAEVIALEQEIYTSTKELYDVLCQLQRSLLPLGLSSLGRGEARAITNLDAVMASLGRICHEPAEKLIPYPQTKRFFYGDTLLAYNTGRIFGLHGKYRLVVQYPGSL